MLTKESVYEALRTIPDPELGISIVDLGLVYDVTISKENIVTVKMTLTTIGCPLFAQIAEPIKAEVRALSKSVQDVVVDLTFEPPWDPGKMSEEAKIQLGFI